MTVVPEVRPGGDRNLEMRWRSSSGSSEDRNHFLPAHDADSGVWRSSFDLSEDRNDGATTTPINPIASRLSADSGEDRNGDWTTEPSRSMNVGPEPRFGRGSQPRHDLLRPGRRAVAPELPSARIATLATGNWPGPASSCVGGPPPARIVTSETAPTPAGSSSGAGGSLPARIATG
jgi:hypothetical protein